MSRPPNADLIHAARAGMTVIDNAGERIGEVEIVHAADPAAVPGTEPDVSPDRTVELLRNGFVKLRTGPLARSRYAGSDQIERVEEHTVYLSVPGSELDKGRPQS